MKRATLILLSVTLLLTLTGPVIAGAGSTALRTSGTVRCETNEPEVTEYVGTYYVTFKWTATKNTDGTVRGRISRTVTAPVGSNGEPYYTYESWAVTGLTRLSDSSVEFTAPGSRGPNWQSGGPRWRVYPDGRTGLLTSYCETCSSWPNEVFHDVGTGKMTVR